MTDSVDRSPAGATDSVELADTPRFRLSPEWERQCEVAARTGTTDDLVHTIIGQLPFHGLPWEPPPGILDRPMFPYPDSPTYREVHVSEKLRGCPFGAHPPGEPHHYSCWAWMD